MLKFKKTLIPGCYEIQPVVISDKRGSFVKIYNKNAYDKLNLCTKFEEEFYSVSNKNVVRGMHFQRPPHHHVKLVYCTKGNVFDVLLDLRLGSPTYGKCFSFQLSAEKANCLYIPEGLAHGFCALTDSATLVYKVGSDYSPEHDTGINPFTLGIHWPTSNPIISDRDKRLPSYDNFLSPFFYE
jgi:dTDP-4-dehydrorhamnose 3,5-epimerase